MTGKIKSAIFECKKSIDSLNVNMLMKMTKPFEKLAYCAPGIDTML
jgi:hypothetical protein